MNLLYKLYFVQENNFKILTRCKFVEIVFFFLFSFEIKPVFFPLF